jgi:hypothetical protein
MDKGKGKLRELSRLCKEFNCGLTTRSLIKKALLKNWLDDQSG